MSQGPKDRIATVVEGALSAFSKARHAAQGAIRLYNTVAEHAPIPMPKLPDGSRRVWPRERYSPPPPRPTTNMPKTPPLAGDVRPAATARAMPTSEPAPAARSASAGIVVEVAGPTLEEYRQGLASRGSSEAPT